MNNKNLNECDFDKSIMHRLLLHSSMLSNMGTLRGKMGLVIFFMHYHKFTNNALYEDVAGELLDEIEDNLHKNLPITFESGLAGIGWGIDYLIQNKFIEGNSQVINEEIDQRIMQTDPRRIIDFSLETGLGGILFYVLAHINMVFGQHKEIPFDLQYLYDMYIACTNLQSNKNAPVETLELTESYILFYEEKRIPYNNIWNLSMFIEGIPDFNSKNISHYQLGIRKGLAGVLLEKYCLLNN